MATLFARHRVADYAAWKQVYDEVAGFQKAAGVTSHGVYQAEGDPNDVTIYHEFATVEAAKAFAGNPDLKAAMQRAGVVGAPDIWITNRVGGG